MEDEKMEGAGDCWQISGLILTMRRDKLEVLRGKDNEFGLELVELRCLKDTHEEMSGRRQ